MNIVHMIQKQERETIADAQRRYTELLTRGDDGNATVAQLRELMTKLGKTAEQVAADLAVINEAKRLATTAEAGNETTADREAALVAASKFGEEKVETIRQLHAEHQRLINRYNELEMIRSRADDARNRLSELKSETRSPHVALLRFVDIPEMKW